MQVWPGVSGAVAQHRRVYARGTISRDTPPSAQFVVHKSPAGHLASGSPSPSSVIAYMQNKLLNATSHLRQIYHVHSAERFGFQLQ